MVPSLPLLSFESSVSVNKTLIEKKKKKGVPVPKTIDSSAIYMVQHTIVTLREVLLPELAAAMIPTLCFFKMQRTNSQYQLKQIS